jgi:anti-sigma factor NepR-like protein
MGDKRNRVVPGAHPGDGKEEEVRPAEQVKRRPRGAMDERWLERKVRDMYQEVVNEPVPDDILKILNKLPKLD